MEPLTAKLTYDFLLDIFVPNFVPNFKLFNIFVPYFYPNDTCALRGSAEGCNEHLSILGPYVK